MKLITTLMCPKKLVSASAKVAKAFRNATIECVFWNMIGGISGKQSTFMKPEKLAQHHQTLSSWVESGYKTRLTGLFQLLHTMRCASTQNTLTEEFHLKPVAQCICPDGLTDPVCVVLSEKSMKIKFNRFSNCKLKHD